MKLAFCLFKYFPYGGLQRDFLRIARECLRRGHQVDVFTMQWQGEREPGLNIILVPAKGLQNHARSRSFVQQIQDQWGAYDKVIGFNKMPGLDIYYAADTCYYTKAQAQRSWAYRLTARYRSLVAYERAVFATTSQTAILLLSAAQQHEYHRAYQTPAPRFHLLPPGIAPDRVASAQRIAQRGAIRERLGALKNELMLLFVGSGFKTKGLDRVLLGLASLPPALQKQCRLYVVGSDRPTRFLKMARALKVDAAVKFLGGRDDVPDFLLAADLLVHPAYNENTGTVLLEALAAGLPVLTTDVCGYAHYICAAAAGKVLASPFQQTAFNETLAALLVSPDKAQWRTNALHFSKTADIYALPLRAADFIENYRVAGGLKKYSFAEMMALNGEVYRALEGRCTLRIVHEGQAYFIKRYTGIGWREIFKNILNFRWPVLSAKNEWRALQQLHALGIFAPEIVAYDCRGSNPARLKSFLLTKSLVNCTSLEDVCKTWQQQKPAMKFKQELIKKIATIARSLHQNGMNHRDFYICHFFLEQSTHAIYLIDLHRAQLRKRTPLRWVIKDLAGLYFSTQGLGLTLRDHLRFMQEYRNKPIRQVLTDEPHFWIKVKKRGEKLYQEQYQ